MIIFEWQAPHELIRKIMKQMKLRGANFFADAA